MRIPFIISGVGHPGESNHQNILVEDVFPTVLEIANISNKKPLDGKSILPLIQKKQSNETRMLIWHHPHMRSNGSKDIQPFSAIRQGKWKLLYFHKDQHFELYDTENDLSESKNLLLEQPKKARLLAEALGEKLKKSDSHMLINAKTKLEIPYLLPSLN